MKFVFSPFSFTNTIDIFAKHSKYPINVKFVNKSGDKVKVYWIDEKGKFKKVLKLKEGRIDVLGTFEGYAFIADDDAIINGNTMFLVHTAPGGHGEVKAEITRGPSKICVVIF